MKKYKPSLYLLLFIILSNLPPLNVFFRIFGGDSIVQGSVESLYVTKDLKYIYGGKIKDTLQNYCYRQYRAMYPLSNPTLYRLQPIEPWKFWRWGEYLLKEKWHQPFCNYPKVTILKHPESCRNQPSKNFDRSSMLDLITEPPFWVGAVMHRALLSSVSCFS